jgi:acetyl-CoA synthetase
MIGLSDLAVRGARSWAEASARFSLPVVTHYNIAADCLRHSGVAVRAVDEGDVTFAELDRLSGRFASGLRSRGVGMGDRVAVKLSQGVDMAVAILGVLRLGAIVVPLSNVLGDDGLAHRLADSDPRMLVAAGSEHERELGVPLVTVAGTLGDTVAPPVATAPDTPAILLYTSGTTGKPKGVLHGHRAILGHHAIDFALDGIRPDDVSYGPVDWAWGGGLFLGLLVPLARGVPVVAFREPRFDPERALSLMRSCGVSIGLYPPTVLRLLRQSGLARPDGLRLRCFVTGAEAVEPELLDWAAQELGVTVNNAYGQTEANALIGHSSALGALDVASLGRPYPGRQIALLDEELQPVAVGEPGQIAVAASDPVCMLGYWNQPDATERKLAGGWLPTGDTAHADERGQIFFHGRSDDIIKSGAYRIGPGEVEAALLLDASVAECAVVGLPDAARGEVVTAFVRLRGDGLANDELTARLQQRVRAKVGAHAYPRDVRYLGELPRTSTGKVDRAGLRRSFG